MALVATGIIVVIASAIYTNYFSNNPFQFDGVYYSFYNARLSERLSVEDRLGLALEEWLNNPRHPLRTVPLILFSPELLRSPVGQVAITIPVLFVTLALVGWTVYLRSGLLSFTTAVIALFASFPWFYRPALGIAANEPDITSALLITSAVLCLLNSNQLRDLRWVAGFAVLAACAALNRYVAAGYMFVMAAPIFFAYLYVNWRSYRSPAGIVKPTLVTGLILAVLAGPFLSRHLQANINFYNTFGFNLTQGATESLLVSGASLGESLGVHGLFSLIVLAIMNIRWLPSARSRFRDVLTFLWMADSLILLQVLLLGSKDQRTMLYTVPSLVLLTVIPFVWRGESVRGRVGQRLTRWVYRFALVNSVITALVLLGILSTMSGSQKSFHRALADELHRTGSPVIWNAYFDEVAWMPSMEAFYAYGDLPLPAGQEYFSVVETIWRGEYPDLTPDAIAQQVYANTNRWVDIAVVLVEPDAERTLKLYNNPISLTVAQYMARAIPQNSNWTRIFEIESETYGRVAGYRNNAASSGAYAHLLSVYRLTEQVESSP